MSYECLPERFDGFNGAVCTTFADGFVQQPNAERVSVADLHTPAILLVVKLPPT
jgi:hypothetical protein